jgi:hypothetical protein
MEGNCWASQNSYRVVTPNVNELIILYMIWGSRDGDYERLWDVTSRSVLTGEHSAAIIPLTEKWDINFTYNAGSEAIAGTLYTMRFFSAENVAETHV